MRVDGIVFADERLIAPLRTDPALGQLANVAHLPGLVGGRWRCPTSTSATASRSAASPRSMRTTAAWSPRRRRLRHQLRRPAAGTICRRGGRRAELEVLADAALRGTTRSARAAGRRAWTARPRRCLVNGARWAVERGWGDAADLDATEQRGEFAGADPGGGLRPGARARPAAARLARLGQPLHRGPARGAGLPRGRGRGVRAARGPRGRPQIHTGSRGLGHQVCDRRPCGRWTRPPRVTASSCPTASSAARRSARPRPTTTSPRWRRRPTSPLPTARSSRTGSSRGASSRSSAPAERRVPRTVYDVAHNIAKWEQHHVARRIPPPLRAPQGRHAGVPGGPSRGPWSTARWASRC